jgi:hypothetical protein
MSRQGNKAIPLREPLIAAVADGAINGLGRLAGELVPRA